MEIRPMRTSSPARAAAGAALIAVLGLAACASHGPSYRYQAAGPYKSSSLRPYAVGGRTYDPQVPGRYDEVGLASWYNYPSHTRKTADGEWFDGQDLTAAHKTLPLPCLAEVTNLQNGRSIKVRINDRGPFVAGRIIDLSRAAADRLGFAGQGTVKVRVKFLGPAPGGADRAEIGEAGVDDAG
jgi:rare lipoprotein A